MTELEQRFDRYFATLDEDDPLRSAHILDLNAAQSSDARDLATAFADIKTEINNRFETNAVGIVAPEGPVRIHMDYIASSMVNAFAFYFEGWYFIGITDGMLELFAKSCTALWRLNPLAEFLGIYPAREKRDSVFQFALLLELQYISNHELGHMFHGHCAGLREGRYRAEFDVATLVANSIGMEGQARELEADGYAINLLLKNLLQSDTGTFMHHRVQSTKSVREFVVTLFLLSLAATLYHVKSAPFDAAKVRGGDHSDGLIRMNILLGEILGWCADNIDWKDAISQDDFQRDIDGALALMTQDVSWPKASEGGKVVGKQEIRGYWTRQWGEFDPHVEPLAMTEEDGGKTRVRVHQLVKRLQGDVLSDSEVLHVFTVKSGLIAAMDLGDEADRTAGPSAAFAHRC
jgi:hypothetical protein